MKSLSTILSILLLLISLSITSCDPSIPVDVSTKTSDTISIGINEVFQHRNPNFSLRIDSVLNDSRCPIGALCIWEGNAEIRFELTNHNSKPIKFNLNTSNIFRKDTLISGIKFKLLELNNLRNFTSNYSYQNYRAKIYYSTLIR